MKWYLEVLKKYAIFSGRARRSEYWYFFLFNMIINVLLTIIDLSMNLGEFGISGFYSLAVLVPSIAVTVRRMHDVGKSGWYCLIPFYNLYLCVLEGDKGKNEYGLDPKNPEVDFTDHLVG